MEEVMFQAYLKFAEEKKLFVWKANRSPKKIKCFFVPLALFCVISSFVLFVKCLTTPEWNDYTILSSFITAIPGVLMFWFSEYIKIKNKSTDINEYRKYYDILLNWLKSNDYSNKQSIQLLHDRLLENISENETPHKEQNARLDDWIQVLGIPFMLLAITTFIDHSATLAVMKAYVFSTIFACFELYFLFLFCKSLWWFPSKCKLEQMRCFANDLQGVLDLQSIRNSEEGISCAKEKDSNNVKIDMPSSPSKKSKRKRK